MEDYDVRQALAIIKDRVQEIKQEPHWKENDENEWAQEQEKRATSESYQKVAKREPDLNHSVYSYSKFYYFDLILIFAI